MNACYSAKNIYCQESKMPRSTDSAEEALQDENVQEAMARGVIELSNGNVVYNLKQKKSYNWSDPEEWVRARTIAFLIVEKSYPANRMKTEVTVPRRTPSDFADIIVYNDDECRSPYIVVENKSAGQRTASRDQGIEQGFGNANSLRAPFVLYDEYVFSRFWNNRSHGPMERDANRLGPRDVIPEQYGNAPEFRFVAGGAQDIGSVSAAFLESKIRRAHSVIWAGGRRDPLTAFDEWSKLLFAKVIDERRTPTGEAREFQVGAGETTAAVANRVHRLFAQGCRDDPSIFPTGTRINLPDKKIFDVVQIIEEVSFVRTDVDSIGRAFEDFFGSVFRGELGQYFTMRQLARFSVAMLDINHEDYVLDPTSGSGGFLLEALLQVWHRIDERFSGSSEAERQRLKYDFAQQRVFGIEIHAILSRICKINLLLHHDGHTNIEADRSCLDTVFTRPRLNPDWAEKFTRIVGNPPFGDSVEAGDEDHLGANTLDSFTIAEGRKKVASEHVILERSIDFLEDGGRLGLVIPDGLLNNQGELSNCPQTRRFLARNGFIEAIISLPDYAFRKSGAQNKTSIIFFQKFTAAQRRVFNRVYDPAIENGDGEEEAIAQAFEGFDHHVFLAEATFIGYTPTGAPSVQNELYRADEDGRFLDDQSNTILGEYREFLEQPRSYDGRTTPDCMGYSFTELWRAHSSHRLDPKYYLFKREEATTAPEGWVSLPVHQVMRKREDEARPEDRPDESVVVMTLSQTGEIRPREAGKGRNPPEWRGSYFEDSPSQWFAARAGDIVFSGIDLWKGCIAVVPEDFDGALVTKEFPIYEVTDDRIDPNFMSCLLRSRYFQRAFRAITTGHSNRRRTQVGDFEALNVFFPEDRDLQVQLIDEIQAARTGYRAATRSLRGALLSFSDIIDGRGEEELPDIEDGADPDSD